MQVIALSRKRLRADARLLSRGRFCADPRHCASATGNGLPVTASALAAIRAAAGLDGPVVIGARPLRVAA